jgi:putative endonuclease
VAEALAVLALRLTGHRILARAWRTPVGEIDVVARRGRVLLLVEVKARATRAAALAAVRPRQQRRIRRAAELFAARNPGLADLDHRFDVILVTPWHWPMHVKDAWR